MTFILGLLTGFLGTEFGSAWMHRYLFHGPWWRIHQTHHLARHSPFELNDVFSLFFAILSMILFLLPNAFCFAVACGITVYGIIYFIIHDVLTHRRYFKWSTQNPWILNVVAQHRVHHQKSSKEGQGPYGLFF
ncbi:MAG: sterol desaturase family protein [Pseudobdellovibrionaceae bacterium]